MNLSFFIKHRGVRGADLHLHQRWSHRNDDKAYHKHHERKAETRAGLGSPRFREAEPAAPQVLPFAVELARKLRAPSRALRRKRSKAQKIAAPAFLRKGVELLYEGQIDSSQRLCMLTSP